MRRILAVVGMPGSGKGEVVKMLKKRGMDVVVMGDLVREAFARTGMNISDASLGKYAGEERERHGMGIWAKRVLERVGHGSAVIDGVRGDAELDVYRRAFEDDLVVVAVYASPEIRYQRLVDRARKDAPVSKEDFGRREERELGWGIGRAMGIANVMVHNEGDLESLSRDVDELWSHVLEDR